MTKISISTSFSDSVAKQMSKDFDDIVNDGVKRGLSYSQSLKRVAKKLYFTQVAMMFSLEQELKCKIDFE